MAGRDKARHAGAVLGAAVLVGGVLLVGALPAGAAGGAPELPTVTSEHPLPIILIHGGPTADLVANTDATQLDGYDPVNDPIDGSNYVYLTQSAAEASLECPTSDGLPDDGVFAATADHPALQLGYRNDDDGPNATLLTPAETTASFDTGSRHDTALHLIVSSTEGQSTLEVTTTYADGEQDARTVEVADWFADPIGGAYALIDGMDRMTATGPFVCDDQDTAALWGYALPVDPARPLVSVSVSLVSGFAAPLFGVVAVQAPVPAAPPAAPVPLGPHFTG